MNQVNENWDIVDHLPMSSIGQRGKRPGCMLGFKVHKLQLRVTEGANAIGDLVVRPLLAVAAVRVGPQILLFYKTLLQHVITHHRMTNAQ